MSSLVCGVDKKNKELLFYCNGYQIMKKAEKALSNLSIVEIFTENGLRLLLEKLDVAFSSDDGGDGYNIFFNLVI